MSILIYFFALHGAIGLQNSCETQEWGVIHARMANIVVDELRMVLLAFFLFFLFFGGVVQQNKAHMNTVTVYSSHAQMSIKIVVSCISV